MKLSKKLDADGCHLGQNDMNINDVNSWKSPEQEATEAWIMSIIATGVSIAALWCVWCIWCVLCKRRDQDEPTFLPNLHDRSWTDIRDQSLSDEPLYDHHQEDSVLGDNDNDQEEDLEIGVVVNEKKNN